MQQFGEQGVGGVFVVGFGNGDYVFCWFFQVELVCYFVGMFQVYVDGCWMELFEIVQLIGQGMLGYVDMGFGE